MSPVTWIVVAAVALVTVAVVVVAIVVVARQLRQAVADLRSVRTALEPELVRLRRASDVARAEYDAVHEAVDRLAASRER